MAVLLLLLIGAISLQVVCSALSINPLLTLNDSLPFIGKAVSLNSLLDFQWHFLVVIGLIPASIVWLKDKHVRVDFFYAKRSEKVRSIVDLAGNLIFALPFLWLIVPSSIDFAHGRGDPTRAHVTMVWKIYGPLSLYCLLACRFLHWPLLLKQ